MFSCCRANPKSSKKSKKLNEDNAKEQEISQQNDASTKSDNKKLIIPTITIENGKTTTDSVTNNEQKQQPQENGNTTAVETVNSEKDKLNENENITTTTIVTEAIEKTLKEAENINAQSTTTTTTKTANEEVEVANEAVITRTTETNDCDPDLKPSVAENLEHLVNRLEKLVERLERSISARELEIANRTFDSVLEKKRASFDLETTELPPVPVENLSVSEQTVKLNQRIERIEESLGKINERHSLSSRSDSLVHNHHNQLPKDNSLEDIPTVLDDFSSLPPPPPPLELNMSVLGFQDIMAGPLSQYLALSAKIGGDVAKHAEFVKKAFDAQLQYVTLATQCSQPNQSKQMELLKPTSDQITAIQDFREKNRASQFFNHLSAISESIPALGWVCVSPTPGPHVKEMNDAGQFYTNRVLKEWKEKDTTHVEWARAWVQTLTELQQYIKQYHTTGLVWSGKGAAPASGAAPPPPPMGCPPPPPPPTFDMSNMNLGEGPDDRSALFAEINQGENITKNLKKVTADMQTHKNPTLRTGPAPFKTPTQFGSSSKPAVAAPVVKDPVFTRDGKKWLIEYQKNNNSLLVENAEMNNVVYMFKCEGSVLTVKGKVNNVVLDSCKKCSLVFDSVVASIEFVNCQSVQMQVLGFVPTISIDKTDGCQMYLSKESLGVEIVSSKSSEMNIMLPEDSGDYTELPVPEQFKTTISGKTLKTVCVDSLG
ncbi:adenylyl cyclase-associated protein 1 isoform X2 [Lucilia sericata]|uniref:adenylyl cyclase-associated protein 1 isoform X2 n=1 Tax=Lucilia sericata TaxID=13632 RepID=UPI0018A7ECC7|nr:adenylyl cyclase-associated protein 1 isoform X2 [Lucilia sericata]